MSRTAKIFAVVVAALGFGTLAAGTWAYFTSAGTASASASVGTLASPVITTASQLNPGVGTVHLEWSAPTAPGGASVDGYYVQRLGSPSVFACGTSASAPFLTAASCDDTGLSVGSYQYAVTAVWRSWTSVSATESATVSKADTTAAVVSTTGSPSAAGQAVTYTATVSVTSPGAGTPTGNIAFFDDGSPIGSCGGAAGNAMSGTSATCEVTYAGVGSHAITAQYLGGGFHDPSPGSPAITQVVAKASTTTSLTITGSPVTYGNEQTATFSASVTPAFPGTLTGSIAIQQGATSLCTIILPAASCVTSATALPAGTHSITAVYSGDANFLTSTSAGQSLTVGKAPLTVTASSASMTYGTGAPTITPGYAGFVSGEGAVNLATQPSCSTTANSTSTVAGSPYPSTCSGGASTNYAFTYAAGSVTVNKANQVITFTSTAPSSATAGGGTYTVTATGGGSGNAVTFSIAGSSSSVCTISGSTVSFTAAGTCAVNANQSAGPNHNAATQATQSFTVSAATNSMTITGIIRNQGNNRVKFTGTGGTSGAAVTVTICTANPCTTATTTGTVSATVTANGSWTTNQSADLANNTYYARAVQASPAATSAVLSFVVPAP